jgi:ATP-dependent Clp protease ATP-binding subunit ClpA
LQVFDHGTLTDANGRKSDFRNVIIVMTTNAGADRMSRASVGFTTQDHTGDAMASIKQMFSPEFRNRLDAIIQFNALDKRTIANVVDKFLIELEAQLDEKKVTVDVTDEAREWLAVHGYDKIMGARPMARLIQEKVKRALAEELLFGELEHGGDVVITVKNDDIAVEIKKEEEELEGAV